MQESAVLDHPVSEPSEAVGDPETNLDLVQLKRAERIVLVIRWIALTAWAPLLYGAGLLGAASVQAVFAGVAAYTIATSFVVVRGTRIRATAVATMVGDALGVACMCFVTRGIASDIYPYFHLHLLTTALRFGGRETAAAFLLDAALSTVLYALVPGAPLRQLWLSLFYLLFVATIAGLLSRDARRHYRRALQAVSDRAAVAIENTRLLEQVLAGRNRSQELLRRLIHTEEEERRRLAGVVHDRMGQRFFELYYGIGRCREAVTTGVGDVSPLLAKLDAEARTFAGEVRNIMNELRPPLIDEFGFAEAARNFLTSLEAQHELNISLHVDDSAECGRPEVDVMLYRILQEAVLNARKHSAAKNLHVELRREGTDVLCLSVRDDGDGFDPSDRPLGHYGLLYMRERAEACGGELEVSSRPGAGTEITVRVPYS